MELPPHSIQHDYMDPIIRPEPLPTAPRKESITTRHPEVSSPTTETAPALPEAVAYPQLSSQLQVSSMPLPKNSIQQDVRPVPPSYPKLHRRRTFIDNPFNGFTTTTSKLYDVPPIAFQHQQQQLESLSHSFSALSVSSPKLKGTQRPSSTEPVVSVSSLILIPCLASESRVQLCMTRACIGDSLAACHAIVHVMRYRRFRLTEPPNVLSTDGITNTSRYYVLLSFLVAKR